MMYLSHAPSAVWGLVVGAAALAAWWDVRTGRIPNLLTLPLFFGGLVWAGASGGLPGLAGATAAAAAVALPFVVLFLMGAGGAGDAKLMAAVGAWLGLGDGLLALLSVLVAGALLGLLLALFRGKLRPVLSRIGHTALSLALGFVSAPRRAPRLSARTEGMLSMPYGVSILAGTSLAALGVLLWQL
jgi:prepilin peptidase CpaA